MQTRTLVDALKQHIDEFGPEAAAASIVDTFTRLTAQRLIFLSPPPEPVLDESELRALDRRIAGDWLSGKAVWLAVRKTEYTHQTAINLGRQLSARYRKQRKVGPTRMYWIEDPAITDAKA